MSYDIEIATFERPRHADLVAAVGDTGEISGELGADAGQVLVHTRRWSLEIDGPLRVELEDLDERLALAAPGARWLVQLHVTIGAPAKARVFAARVAVALAKASAGAAFDPQSERVLFPRGAVRLVPPTPQTADKHTLECEWCVAPERAEAACAAFLDALRVSLPEALPRRFGTFEPLQYRFDEEAAMFERLWREEEHLFFWTCRRPALSGTLSKPSADDSRHSATSLITVSLEGNALRQDDRWREVVGRFFERVAVATGSFFGRAVMNPPRRSWSWATVDEISAAPMYPLERGGWEGIPRHAAWLQWFSARHVELVPELREHEHPRRPSAGVLVVDDRNLVHDAGHLLALPDDVYRTCFGPDGSPQPELANRGFKTRPAARILSLAEGA